MTGPSRAVLATVLGLFGLILMVAFGMVASGMSMGDLWHDAGPALVALGVCVVAIVAAGATMAATRVRRRRTRHLARYQLVLSQADEATIEEVAAAYEQLVQTVRQSVSERVTRGQPWLALESWFVPPHRTGETGTAALMLLCPPELRESAMAALRRCYPDLSLRPDPSEGARGRPLEFVQPQFVPGHVMRVKKQRAWELPIGTAGRQGEASNAKSTMAGVIRQQQQAGRLSCVRWCLLPAPDGMDSRAADKLEGFGDSRPSPARSNDIQNALAAAGGAMCYLELQAAVETQKVEGRRGKEREESFSELQNVCRVLLGAAMSHRGANHLTERLMVYRQQLYRRRWVSGEPPLLPELGGSTLVSPRELALLMELPSLGSEHQLPLQRNTVPYLPVPTEVPRARQVDLELPGDNQPDRNGYEVVDAELVDDGEPAPR